MWKNLDSVFPDHNVMNMGFGGSEMADLLYYADKLITSFQPVQVFIYEGDNRVYFLLKPGWILRPRRRVRS